MVLTIASHMMLKKPHTELDSFMIANGGFARARLELVIECSMCLLLQEICYEMKEILHH